MSEVRLRSELGLIQKDETVLTSGMKTGLTDASNLFHWTASFEGAVDTPYEGGTFVLSIEISPQHYPFRAPQFRFVTPIFHPEVDTEGNMCFDILGNNWTPALMIHTATLCIASSINGTEFGDDAMRPDLVKLFLEDRIMYE